MRRPIARLVVPALAAALLAACSGSTPSPTPESTAAIEAKVLLRVTQAQTLPPLNTFSWLPLHGLVVRPLLPGEGDPCAGLV